jgi:putative ABC transport system substrate-binding protein
MSPTFPRSLSCGDGHATTQFYQRNCWFSGSVAARGADLPVLQATKFEFYLNLKTAKALGIAVPLPLSGRADGVFE